MILEVQTKPFWSSMDSSMSAPRVYFASYPSFCSQQMVPPAFQRDGSILGHGSALPLMEPFLKLKGQYSAMNP